MEDSLAIIRSAKISSFCSQRFFPAITMSSAIRLEENSSCIPFSFFSSQKSSFSQRGHRFVPVDHISVKVELYQVSVLEK
jgi:hypothetical protein